MHLPLDLSLWISLASTCWKWQIVGCTYFALHRHRHIVCQDGKLDGECVIFCMYLLIFHVCLQFQWNCFNFVYVWALLCCNHRDLVWRFVQISLLIPSEQWRALVGLRSPLIMASLNYSPLWIWVQSGSVGLTHKHCKHDYFKAGGGGEESLAGLNIYHHAHESGFDLVFLSSCFMTFVQHSWGCP